MTPGCVPRNASRMLISPETFAYRNGKHSLGLINLKVTITHNNSGGNMTCSQETAEWDKKDVMLSNIMSTWFLYVTST